MEFILQDGYESGPEIERTIDICKGRVFIESNVEIGTNWYTSKFAFFHVF